MPTVLFTTERFAELATMTADELELPNARIVVVPHPLGGTDAADVRAWGEATLDRVLEHLEP